MLEPHDGPGLVALLQRPNVALHVNGLAASGPLAALIPTGGEPHIAELLRRLELAAGDEAAQRWPVKLAVLVHEHPEPGDVHAALDRLGLEREASTVVALAEGFGELWQPDLDPVGYTDRHRDHLRELLLFELAHEGRATEPMRAIAERGGLHDALAGWEQRLRGA